MRFNLRKTLVIGIVGVSVVLGGKLFLGALEFKRDYDYWFYNGTKITIDNATMRWKANGRAQMVGGSILHPGGKSGSGNPDNFPVAPPPKKATVTWQTKPDGKEHQQDIEIAKLVPEGAKFSGTIWIKFTDKGVKVVVLTFDEMEQMLRDNKEYP
ncbi:MAG TPA: hypothetical protein VFC78_17225 [Tepidisphaeraceae bacterium]|nr:hypothetical protein [Tepidisphaeraceae bacterium]